MERKRYVVMVPDCGIDGCEDEGDWRGFYGSKEEAERVARYMIEEGDTKVHVAEIRETLDGENV